MRRWFSLACCLAAATAIAAEPEDMKLKLEPGSAAGVRIRTGATGVVSVTLSWADGSNTLLRFQAAKTTATLKPKQDGKTTPVPLTLSNAVVECAALKLKLHVRPSLDGYPEKTKEELAARWESLPPASDYAFPLAFRPSPGGVQVWADGRFVRLLDRDAPLREVTVRTSPGSEATGLRLEPLPADDRFLPLDMARMSRPGAMKGAVVELAAAPASPPFILGSGDDHADVGLARELTGGGMETDPYLARTAFDGMPESLLFSVPLDSYIRAWVLCAAADDPSRDPVLTARLTRFTSDGRGDAFADTTVWLPRDGKGGTNGIEQVGTVAYPSSNGMTRVPLWRVEVPLDPGAIQDLIFFRKNESYNDGRMADRRYLDFELLGKLDQAYPQNDRSHKPDKRSVSGVHVFGLTLERAPVTLEIRQPQPGLVFSRPEKPEALAVLTPRRPGSYVLSWTIRDVDGAEAGRGSRSLDFKAGQGEQVLPIPLDRKEAGWYGIDFTLSGKDGRPLLRHAASFAILPPDTRKAGLESPYGTWWFGSAHRGSADREIGGPLMLKAGLRHTPFGWHPLTEADMAPWKVGAFQVPWLWRAGTGDVAAAAIQYEAAVSNFLAKFPSVRRADIFHESYGGDTIPAELRDARPAPMTEDRARAAQRRIESATAATRVLREKFPFIKTVFGNSNPSASLLAEFFRDGYPRERIDYLGIEAAGQTFMPEKLTEYGTQAGWILRETARKFGHEIPVTSCYEWLYRQERILGPRRLAEWVARDALIAHAYRFPDISLMLLYDAGNCYYNSLWGGSGLCRRYPLLYPKPAYVAYATLTRVLDGATLVRRVPTGSPTVYALEFEREGRRLYALWTPRGTCRTTLRGIGRRATVIDLFGRERSAGRGSDLVLEVGTSPQYVSASQPAKAIEAGPRSLETAPAGYAAPAGVNAADAWELATGPDPRLESPTNTCLPLRTAGSFVLRSAKDPEMGDCLELERVSTSAVPDIVFEYAVLKLKQPVELPGQPSTAGVWVRGNSGWGRIMWAFQDAAGRDWLSCGTPGWGCDSLDWGGDISINFDGWGFLRFPLTPASPVPVITPGGVEGQWVMTGGTNRTKAVAYPVRLTGLAVEMTRKALDLTEMVPVQPVIRLRDPGAW